MSKQKWQETANELIDKIVESKEKIKLHQENLVSDKFQLAELMRENNSNEYAGANGKANFVEFVREGLVKDNVVDAVNGVNKGVVKSIKMADLTKDIDVSFLNVRGYLGD